MQLNLDEAKRSDSKREERDHKTAAGDETQREAKSRADPVIPDQNTCSVHSVFPLACFYLKMRSAQISILAPKLVISSNFFRGRLDKFSALNGVFLAEINNRVGIYHTGLFFHFSVRFM